MKALSSLFFTITLVLLTLESCRRAVETDTTRDVQSHETIRPSLLIVTIDTWRWDYIGLSQSGRVVTPNLDALGQKGIYIPEIETPCPLTTPAHASLFTGLRPIHHRIFDCVHYALDDKIPTLAEGFQEKGYTTAAFVSGETLKERFGLNRGFSHYDDSGMEKRENDDWMSATKDGRKTTDAVLAYLAGDTGTTPLFLWVHYYDLHIPYRPRPHMESLYPDDPYAQEAAYVDAQVGRLIAWIEGDAERQWRVLITGDHGEGLGDHGESGHGYGLHREVRSVPLIIAPKPDQPLVHPQPWSLLDLEPTLRHWFGLKENPGVDGEDLFEEGSDGRLLPSMTLLPSLMFGVTPTLAVRTARYLYIRHGEEELYDLEKDPGETKNLVTASEMRSVYRQLRRTCRNLFPENEIQHVLKPTLSLTSEEEKRLRSIGYLAGSTPNMARLQRVDLYELLADFDKMESTREFCYQNGGWKKMAHAYADFLEKYPRAATVWKNYGKLLLRLGDHSRAIPVLEQAIRLDPADEDSCLNLGTLLLQKGEVEKAEILLNRAARLKPDDPVVHKNLGILYQVYRKEPAKATQHYRKFLALDPGTPERPIIQRYINEHSGKTSVTRELP